MANPHRRSSVEIPRDVQTKILALGTAREACNVLGIGRLTYEEVVAVNGRVSGLMFAKIVKALEKVSAQSARV